MKNLSLSELRGIADILKISDYKMIKKYELKAIISKNLETSKSQHTLKSKSPVKYTKIKQLGVEGKEGKTFSVTNKKGGKFALKEFRKNKSPNTMEKEAKFQIKASKSGISPIVKEYDKERKSRNQ